MGRHPHNPQQVLLKRRLGFSRCGTDRGPGFGTSKQFRVVEAGSDAPRTALRGGAPRGRPVRGWLLQGVWGLGYDQIPERGVGRSVSFGNRDVDGP